VNYFCCMQLYNFFFFDGCFLRKKKEYLRVCVCVCVCVYMYATVLVWRSGNSFVKLLVLSFHLHVGTGINFRLPGLQGKYLYLSIHRTAPFLQL
jgi:hypothetical protein